MTHGRCIWCTSHGSWQVHLIYTPWVMGNKFSVHPMGHEQCIQCTSHDPWEIHLVYTPWPMGDAFNVHSMGHGEKVTERCGRKWVNWYWEISGIVDWALEWITPNNTTVFGVLETTVTCRGNDGWFWRNSEPAVGEEPCGHGVQPLVSLIYGSKTGSRVSCCSWDRWMMINDKGSEMVNLEVNIKSTRQ